MAKKQDEITTEETKEITFQSSYKKLNYSRNFYSIQRWSLLNI